jgi:hypothetical protein
MQKSADEASVDTPAGRVHIVLIVCIRVNNTNKPFIKNLQNLTFIHDFSGYFRLVFDFMSHSLKGLMFCMNAM